MAMLKQLLSNVDYKDNDTHREIYVQFTKQIDQLANPSLCLLIYAIKNITQPSFLIEQTLDVLKLLGQVELIRQRAIEHCSNIVKLNATGATNFFAQRKELLVDIKAQIKGKSIERGCFVIIIHWSCLHHLRYLLTLRNIDLVAEALLTYFVGEAESTLPEEIFYAGWSSDEIEGIAKTTEEAVSLVAETLSWEDGKKLPRGFPYDDKTKARYETDFPLGLSQHHLIRLVDLYLKRVKKLVDLLEANDLVESE